MITPTVAECSHFALVTRSFVQLVRSLYNKQNIEYIFSLKFSLRISVWVTCIYLWQNCSGSVWSCTDSMECGIFVGPQRLSWDNTCSKLYAANYICFRSVGGKLIIVKRLRACYMEKALYKCTTLLFLTRSKSILFKLPQGINGTWQTYMYSMANCFNHCFKNQPSKLTFVQCFLIDRGDYHLENNFYWWTS